MNRKTETEFLAEIDALDKAERYSLAMQRAVREALRARASEDEKDTALAQKDATIKALAEALDSARIAVEDGHIFKRPYEPSGVDALLGRIRSALRLAGGLK